MWRREGPNGATPAAAPLKEGSRERREGSPTSRFIVAFVFFHQARPAARPFSTPHTHPPNLAPREPRPRPPDNKAPPPPKAPRRPSFLSRPPPPTMRRPALTMALLALILGLAAAQGASPPARQAPAADPPAAGPTSSDGEALAPLAAALASNFSTFWTVINAARLESKFSWREGEGTSVWHTAARGRKGRPRRRARALNSLDLHTQSFSTTAPPS